jgi:Inosine-uridine preferring nucleoside hydrolase
MMIPKIFRRAPRVRFPALCFAAILIACGACSSESTVKKTETAVMPKTAVWIDTDPSISSGPREVDDGFALIQAFHSPELDIRGVSVVYGNAPFEQAWPISQEIVRKYGPPGLPIFAGATEAVDLGRETDATRALAAALEKEPLTILALGPVTNVATVLKNHPELGARITGSSPARSRTGPSATSTLNGTRPAFRCCSIPVRRWCWRRGKSRRRSG